MDPVADGQGAVAVGDAAQAARAVPAAVVRVADVVIAAGGIEADQAVQGIVAVDEDLAQGIGLAGQVAGGIVLKIGDTGIRAGLAEQVAQISSTLTP